MKLQLNGLNSLLQDKMFGDDFYDPVSVKKLSKDEKEVYKVFGITHVMDMRSFMMLNEIFMMKYFTVLKDDNNNNYKLDVYNKYNDFKNIASIDGVNVWLKNLNQRNSKSPYIKLLEFLQKEIPVLNYNFYNLAFTRLNSISFNEWKNSMYLIEPYMKSFIDFKTKFFEFKEKIDVKLIGVSEASSLYDLKIMGSSKSEEVKFFGKMYNLAYLEKNNVFWDKDRKKEERDGIKHSAPEYLLELIGLINLHYKNYEFFKKLYNVPALRDIREKKENLQFSLLDEKENLNYHQFYLEGIMARALCSTFDQLEHNDISVLAEHGVSYWGLKFKMNKALYSHPTLYSENHGRDRLYANFEKIFREITLHNKIEKLEIEKEVKVKKNKI